MLASFNGSAQALQVLLKAGARYDCTDEGGNTALMMACDKGHTECARLLISHIISTERGEKGNASADSSKTSSSSSSNGLSVVNLVGQCALMMAAFEGHAVCVQMLLEAGDCGVSLQDNSGNTALILAADNGHVDLCEVILSLGHGKEGTGGEGLQSKAVQEKSQAKKRIKGASVDLTDTAGNTALIYAAHRGHTNVIKRLVAHNCNLDAQNKTGLTALMIAAKGAKVSACKVLLDAGADKTLEDFQHRRTALQWTKSEELRVMLQKQKPRHSDAAVYLSFFDSTMAW
jgi:ankyrin repeat protein